MNNDTKNNEERDSFFGKFKRYIKSKKPIINTILLFVFSYILFSEYGTEDYVALLSPIVFAGTYFLIIKANK